MQNNQYGLVFGGGLNLRESPDVASTRLIQIPNDTTLVVSAFNDTWFSTTYGAYSGYVMRAYIELIDTSADIILSGQVTGGRLNLRRTSSTAADCLIQIPDGTEVEVMDFAPAGEWYRATYGGYTGYVMKRYIATSSPPVDQWAYGRVTTNDLNVRKQPSTSADRWNSPWPNGRIAMVKPAVSGWYESFYRSEAAYVSADFIDLLSQPVSDSIVERLQLMAPAVSLYTICV